MRRLLIIALFSLAFSACSTIAPAPWYERAETVRPEQLELQP